MSQDLSDQAQVAILSAQIKGARFLIKHLQLQLDEVKIERDKLAGIGIECGCGEASCTADADNLRDALAQIVRLKAELESLRKVSAWQPIETAPKDGLKVLVYDESFGLPQKAWFGKDQFNEEYEGWLFGDGDDYSCGMYFTPINPTHWMPLPKPPQEGKHTK